jgi:hypothetical protein
MSAWDSELTTRMQTLRFWRLADGTGPILGIGQKYATLVDLSCWGVCRGRPSDFGLSELCSLASLHRIYRMRGQSGEGRGVVRDLASILAGLHGWAGTVMLRLGRRVPTG